jgi:N-acyl amino acid synthase of PEP-CTERM/exosortase system
MSKKETTLLQDFQEYFELEMVSTPEQMESVYRIRYRVYCEEFGYEPADAFPSHQETDDFDAHSSHCLVTHKSTGMPAGCARLVHVNDQTLMPMEKFCSSSLDRNIMSDYKGKRESMCEFSRLAVDGAFRRRIGERATRFGEITSLDCSKRELRTFSLIAVSTILAAFAMSDRIGRPNCFAMMEPFLPRLLRRSGIVVNPAGTEIDYHGIRAPYHFETHETIGGMVEEMQEFYEVIHNGFSSKEQAHGKPSYPQRESEHHLVDILPSWGSILGRPTPAF